MESDIGLEEIAALTGFGSRTTLFRQLRRRRGLAPSVLRAAQARPGANT